MGETLLNALKNGIIPENLKELCEKEGVSPEVLKEEIISGRAVVVGLRSGRNPFILSKYTRTKVNANIGTSTNRSSLAEEMEKLKSALDAGTDAVMDLSLSDDLDVIRRHVLENSTVPVGTVPIYEAAVMARKKRGATLRLDVEEIFDILEKQMEEGVDFMTIHAGVTRELVSKLKEKPRLEGIVSRGGAILTAYIRETGKENPLYEHFERLLKLARKYDVVLSLGDGMRPGAIKDAGDYFEVGEQRVLGELVLRARENGVMTIVEGPGHVPLHMVQDAVKRMKELNHNAPLYLLGPVVTDIAPGFDHITGAIGGALVAWAGVEFLCYVTPAEHIGLPTSEDVKLGVIAARIAGHAADIAKGIKGAMEWDNEMSKARKHLDWGKMMKLSIHPETFLKLRRERSGEGSCTMCGEYCVFLINKDDE
ncbi:MAG: phosphomethylpyrimidine synthase ThiC [candidate division WOR-3 bacterium]